MNSYKIQAQIELFANSGYIENFGKDQKILLKNSKILSKEEDFPILKIPFSEDIQEVVDKNKDFYNVFTQNGLDENLIEKIVKNSKFYEKNFEGKIKELKQYFNETKDKESIPGYLGRGTNGFVFNLMDDKENVVKFGRVAQMNHELFALLKGKGQPNLSQLVAYSFEDSATILELLPGENLDYFTFSTKPKYSDKDLENLIKTVVNMGENGLRIDPKPSNFMYDPKVGFSILDYHLSSSNYSLADSVLSLFVPLVHIGNGGKRIDWENKEENQRRYYACSLDKIKMIPRLSSILKTSFPNLFVEILKKNKEHKLDSRSTTFGKGYFDKNEFLEVINEASKNYGQDSEEFYANIEEIESLGFF